MAEKSTRSILKVICICYLGGAMSNFLGLGVDGTSGSVGDACGRKTESCLQSFARKIHSVGRLVVVGR